MKTGGAKTRANDPSDDEEVEDNFPGAGADPDSEEDQEDLRSISTYTRKMKALTPHIFVAFSFDNIYHASSVA